MPTKKLDALVECSFCETQIRKDVMEEAEEMIDKVTKDLLHELKNPMMQVGVFFKRFKTTFNRLKNSGNGDEILVSARDLERVMHCSEIIETGIAHMEQILKIGADFMEHRNLEIVAIDLDKILKEVAIAEDDENIKFEFYFGIEKEIYADPVKLKMLALNVFKNAKEAILEKQCKKGGVIRVITGINEKGAFFEIRNNGVPIVDEHLDKVFKRNFSTKESGNGIGLHISREIVRAHGGKIEAISLPDGWTSFRVSLPIKINKIK